MKINIVKILLLTVLVTLFSCQKKEMNLNVMSFNIRLDAASDSLNNWKYRKDVAAQIVKNYNVDIVGMQEVTPGQMQDIKDRLPEYIALGVGREDGTNGPESGEASPLFFKKDKFKALNSGTFWLSETPEKASMGWDAACKRVATWAVLEEISTGNKLFAVNTHLDHVGQQARINGVKLMLDKSMEVAEGYPVVLTGDFNSIPSSDVVQYVLSDENPRHLLSSRDIAEKKKDKSGTFHDFGRIAPEDQEYIDYIFVSNGVKVKDYEVIDEKLDGVFLSDHTPVFASIVVTN